MDILEGLLSLDLATRHNALPMPKITGTKTGQLSRVSVLWRAATVKGR
jgi:hypothetical protein